MTGKERIRLAFENQVSDRVPVDLSGHRSSGISAMVYPKLREYLGLPVVPVKVYDPIQQLAVPDEDILDMFSVDTIEPGRAFALDEQDWHPWELPDGRECLLPYWVRPVREEGRWIIYSHTGRRIAQMPDGASFFEQLWYPMHEREGKGEHEGARGLASSMAYAPTWKETDIRMAMKESMWHVVASPPGPMADGEAGLQRLEKEASRLRKRTDRCIIGLFGGNLLETGQMLFRNDEFLMKLAMDPDGVHAFLDRLTEIHLKDLERYLGAVGNHIDIVLFGDDLGMQSGPQISPDMYREFFKPRHREMWEKAHELAEVKVMLHCCGGVRELLPDLIDAGLDAINPVQTSARGMDPEGLKKDFGKDILFWGGGCDTQRILPGESPDQVRHHVHKQLEIMSRNGGFVFQQVHNILPGVPPENIVAMLETVNHFKP